MLPAQNIEKCVERCGLLVNEIILELENFVSKVKDLELKMILGNPKDLQDAIITIHPGAGGTESQDWAQMLYRMYSRWVEKKGFKMDILDYQPGDEAGIKDLTMEIKGDYSYGLLKAEAGVHRLVRVSPFDSNNRRHTSFASVFVLPRATNSFIPSLENSKSKTLPIGP